MESPCPEGDSNALILPAKKGRKGKAKNQVQDVINQPKLSASQKRKLKKLEEEKERAYLLSESIEALEKHKIPEDAFSLLRSSRNISRDETLKEKRRMAVQFSKAGLEVPSSIRLFGMTSCVVGAMASDMDARPNIDVNDHLHQSQFDQEVLINESASLVPADYEISSESASLAERSSDRNSAQEDERASLPTLGDCSAGRSNPKDQDKLERTMAADFVDSNPQGSSERVHVTPLVVPVFRPLEVEKERRDLPIVGMEQEIMEAVYAEEHPAVIICGQTGCGKTTQVPQFLFEAGFGSSQYPARRGVIGVTQPRRVAVLTTAKRVAYELGLHLGKEVGFQVRYDKRIGESCSIKFMTDGILLREAQSDILLRHYSVIILDEAHERNVNTDILVGMLSRVIRLRQKKFEEQRGQDISPDNMIFPLKLILMSATLRVEDFVSGRRLFCEPPPVINVEGRQFDVIKHYSRRTEIVDYIGQAYKKVLSIHKKLPHGGILVFVTGQREVEFLCKKLRKASKEMLCKSMNRIGCEEGPATSNMTFTGGISLEEINDAFDMHVNSNEENNGFLSCSAGDVPDSGKDESEVSYDSNSESDEDMLVDNGDDGHFGQKKALKDGDLGDLLGKEGALASLKAAFESLASKTASHSNSEGNRVSQQFEDISADSIMETNGVKDNFQTVGALHVLPLYAMLPAKEQLRVYEDVKEGERLVVVATNVAETSLTIPGIKYVVDTGREKVKKYNQSSGMETYEIQWISKASADQRAGRAGRTGPGHCYRLYSRAVYENIFPRFSCPEISKVPVDSIVLVLKSMGIDKVENFPFPTPPEPTALLEAERCLKTLEALDSNGRLTPMGKAMANYPMSPRHSRMLLTVIQILQNRNIYARPNLVLGFAIAAAAALSHSSPFQMQYERSHPAGGCLEEDGEYGSVDDGGALNRQEKLKKKKLKERIKASHAIFSNPSSDALTVAYALQCFELSEGPTKFCDEYALHLKIMDEMSKLRKQLLQLVFQQNIRHGVDHSFSWTHGTSDDVEQAWKISSNKCPLLSEEEKIVRLAICAGWADRVARKSEKQQKSNAIEYQACMVNEPVFLHRFSSLFSSAPEFLVYSELLHTKRPYMHGATTVQPEWLVEYAGSLCCFLSTEDQKLDYNRSADQVFSVVNPAFGPHMWPLGKQKVQVTDFNDRVKGFAFALLEGNVLPCLKSIREFLSAPPGMIFDRDASGQRRVGNLLMKLKERMIDSRAMLRAVWKDNPTELYAEIADWFTKSFQKKFGALWSKMLAEVELEPSKPREPAAKRVKIDVRRK